MVATPRKRLTGGLLIALLAAFSLGSGLSGASSARADGVSFTHRADKFLSGPGTTAFIAAGLVMPLLHHDPDATQHTLRTADALLTSSVITEVLKGIVREPRPNGGSRNSFPSGHTTAAFAIATMASHYHKKEAPLWYLGAALIGQSRVGLRAHHTHDVIAGALVGYGTARLELSRPHGLLLFPLIKPENRGTSRVGMMLGGTF